MNKHSTAAAAASSSSILGMDKSSKMSTAVLELMDDVVVVISSRKDDEEPKNKEPEEEPEDDGTEEPEAEEPEDEGGKVPSIPSDEDEGVKVPSDEEFFIAEEYYGAGVVITLHGLILTCSHLVPEDSEIMVRRHLEEPRRAEVILRDEELNLAIVKIINKKRNETFKFCTFGDGDSILQGSTVYTISHPDKLTYTLSTVFVAHPDRSGSEIQNAYPLLAKYPQFGLSTEISTARFIQLSCSRGEVGSRGAPVFDESGRVVGLLNLSRGYDFALRTELLQRFCEIYLVSDQRASRGV